MSGSPFRHKMPTRMRRCLPLYLAAIFVFIVIANLDWVSAIPSPTSVLRREPKAPPVPGSTFPQKIWQTWKVGPLNFDERDLSTSRTWITKNPSMRYEVVTDASEMTYVEERYGPSGFDRPDIVDFYQSISLPIIKADLLRYMIMYAEGGIYADIDVEAMKPFHRFIPERYDEKDIDLIVGVEIDQPGFKDHPILGKKSMSFCQWTFAARPEQAVMMRLIENIMEWFKGVARDQGVALGEVQLDFDQVISGTGPSAFTKAVLEEMSRKSGGPKVTWDTFHDMGESKLVGGVLVLTVEAFCAGQGHSDSGNHNARNALVKHHFHASNWPSRHPRYKHPVYGQVEDCNWEPECVRKWDENTGNWDHYSENEQKKIIQDMENARLEREQQQQRALARMA
ncbi:glycosyltransferase family 32 [Trichoderma cornu-damae]|uniref:Glycosyltransferase family 32 n=1 Tax=Trichoderma cornu-damae TaxID=654480 RepID=A0A9P8QQ44_9HYPO|nr:glycosyltransferase family 32 [Trichoderma cornu-damae]